MFVSKKIVPKNEQTLLYFLGKNQVKSEIEVFQFTCHIFDSTSSPTVVNFQGSYAVVG